MKKRGLEEEGNEATSCNDRETEEGTEKARTGRKQVAKVNFLDFLCQALFRTQQR